MGGRGSSSGTGGATASANAMLPSYISIRAPARGAT